MSHEVSVADSSTSLKKYAHLLLFSGIDELHQVSLTDQFSRTVDPSYLYVPLGGIDRRYSEHRLILCQGVCGCGDHIQESYISSVPVSCILILLCVSLSKTNNKTAFLRLMPLYILRIVNIPSMD